MLFILEVVDILYGSNTVNWTGLIKSDLILAPIDDCDRIFDLGVEI